MRQVNIFHRIGFFLLMLIYGNLEIFLQITSSKGNMDLYEILIGLMIKRNTMYVGLLITFIGFILGSHIITYGGILCMGIFAVRLYMWISKYKIYNLLADYF